MALKLFDPLQDAHGDGNLFTLVWANAPALEIIQEEATIPINFENPEMCIMPGDILALLTGNQIKSCTHVVKRHENQPHRTSIMCFVNPSIQKDINPWIQNEHNQGINIREVIQFLCAEFGLPPIKNI